MSLYDFKEEDAFRFAQSVGAKTKRIGDELNFIYCPLCHGGNKRDKGTFSINLRTGQCSCKRSSCSYKGNMITLSKEFGYELTDGVARYYNINNYNGKFRKFREYHRDTTEPAFKYLKDRGISETIAKRYEITTRDKQNNILVFPFKDDKGELKFIKYRNTEYVKGVTEGSKEWCEAKCMPILFGMYQCNPDNETLIITEGQIDSLSVAEAGFENAISVPTGMNGFTWIAHCWDWVHQFKRIIVFGDKEGENITLLDEIRNRFNLQVLVVDSANYLDCKDANEILQKYGAEQVRKCIKDAIQVPIKNVEFLKNTKQINIYETEKLRIGISKIDSFLYGGLPFGGVTNIIGKTGEGKSTLASQIIAQALNQGYKVFIYSGELSNSSYKEGMVRQLAGSHVTAYQDDSVWHNVHYNVPDHIVEKIDNWYDRKCLIYNDSIWDDEEEPLLQTLENTIQQYETRVILIDNLMTALDLEPNNGGDRYEKQSLFVKKVARLAVKYNVLILMVAHKRKDSLGDENDQIMGSSDIGNLSMVTLSYGRDKDIRDDQRLLKISKNRLFGKINTTGWILDYDEKSKRIYGKDDDVNFEYDWNVDNGFITDISEEEDVPF